MGMGDRYWKFDLIGNVSLSFSCLILSAIYQHEQAKRQIEKLT